MTAERARPDVLVVGAGPAGIAAAVRAAEAGARVLVVDEGRGPGGQIWRPGAHAASAAAAARPWLARFQRSGIETAFATSVVDVQVLAGDAVRALAESRDGPREIDARIIVLATGARERFLPFPGWTLPNVFGVGGVQALLKSGMPVRGKRVVLAGSGPLLMPVAASLARAGARVLMVAEQAPRERVARFAAALWRTPRTLAQAARYRAAFASAPYALGTWVRRAEGDDVVRSVTVTDGRRERTIACDIVGVGFGLVPNLELPRRLDCAIADGLVVVDTMQRTTVSGVLCAGEPTGVAGMESALAEGALAGVVASGREPGGALRRRVARQRSYAGAIARAFALRDELRALASTDTIVCRCEDVPLGALDPAWSWRQAKLYTRVGMGPCQGRICGAALECLRGWSVDAVRMPASPARVHTLASSAAAARGAATGAR